LKSEVLELAYPATRTKKEDILTTLEIGEKSTNNLSS